MDWAALWRAAGVGTGSTAARAAAIDTHAVQTDAVAGQLRCSGRVLRRGACELAALRVDEAGESCGRLQSGSCAGARLERVS